MLSRLQKTRLVLVAREAYQAMAPRSLGAAPSGAATGEGEAVGGGTASFEEWRHREVARACGKAGLRCCEQRDYAGVMAHFLNLAGRTEEAMRWALRSVTEPKRVAEAVLFRELGKAGLERGYVEAICRRQYRCSVLEASEKQLWGLVFTVRNRGRSKKMVLQKATKETKATSLGGS